MRAWYAYCDLVAVQLYIYRVCTVTYLTLSYEVVCVVLQTEYGNNKDILPGNLPKFVNDK